jgi:hypothetical protein
VPGLFRAKYLHLPKHRNLRYYFIHSNGIVSPEESSLANMKYCPSCQRNVNTEHSWSFIVLIILLILGVIPGLIYLAVRWKRRCPICKTPESMMYAPQFQQGPVQYPGMAPQAPHQPQQQYQGAPPVAPPQQQPQRPFP